MSGGNKNYFFGAGSAPGTGSDDQMPTDLQQQQQQQQEQRQHHQLSLNFLTSASGADAETFSALLNMGPGQQQHHHHHHQQTAHSHTSLQLNTAAAGGGSVAMSQHAPGPVHTPRLSSLTTSPLTTGPGVTSASSTCQRSVTQTPVEPAAAFTPYLPSLFNFAQHNTLSVKFSEAKKVSKSPSWTFSAKLNKLFCKNVTPVTFQLHTDSPLPHGSELHVAAWKNGVIVTRCPNHQFKQDAESEVQLFDTDRSKFIVAEGSTYVQRDDGGQYLVLPIGDGLTCDYTVILYFMCFSSCSTIGRKELRLQLKVESAGCELCQTSVTMRVCACPGRDRINLESRDTAEKEEQGGSAYAESPFPTLSLPVPVKREHSDSEGDEEVTHQVILKGPRRAVDACIENLVLDAKQYSIQLGGSRLVWYTEQREPAGAESSQVSSSSGDSEPPKKKLLSLED
ncbi:cellular tumor antigen p53-like isoform X2 [Sycon ciliatum]|uniref:cellular tumor antigen p53-like isoform X2 n=1 Tax=Sycon ciliatum TaxID=27933 RepID=UPI0031F6BDFD